MNERIRELEQQCWDYARGHVNTQKLALSIIQTCADIADRHVREGDIDIAQMIKQHFGVEE